MAKQSLGLIETIGLTAAVEAADAAVKSANVTLVGYELSKGDGMTLVKVQGDVGAVTAAISAAAVAAGKVGRVVSTRVIARPSDSVEGLICTPDTVGISHAKVAPQPTPCAPEPVAKPQQTMPEQVAPEQASPVQALSVETPASEEAQDAQNSDDADADADEEPHDDGQETASSGDAEKTDSQKKRKKKK